jgi:uncharacterized protein
LACFVDTSCWFAAANSNDQFHKQATAILQSQSALLTTDYIILETWRLLQIKIDWQTAEFFWKTMRQGVAIVEQVTPVDLERAWIIGTEFSDQEFSLTDRTSFAVMMRFNISRVATFDSDFAIFRFGKKMTEAFAIVR